MINHQITRTQGEDDDGSTRFESVKDSSYPTRSY